MARPEQTADWYDMVPIFLSPKDGEVFGRMRDFFLQRPTPQIWYYPFGGKDNLSIFIAPRQTNHWFVDLGYSTETGDTGYITGYRYTARGLTDNFVRPFERLGARVELALPWEAALRQRRQTIVIDTATRIELVGADIDREQIIPKPYDVMYNNDNIGMEIPAEFIELRTGGYYVFAAAMDFGNSLKHHSSGLSLTDFGLTKRAAFEVENFSLPGIDEIETAPGGIVVFQVFEKTRDFTKEEEGILKQAA